jgi:hypothetical protein
MPRKARNGATRRRHERLSEVTTWPELKHQPDGVCEGRRRPAATEDVQRQPILIVTEVEVAHEAYYTECRRRAFVCCGCFVSVLELVVPSFLALVLYFLIPRSPTANYVSTYVQVPLRIAHSTSGLLRMSELTMLLHASQFLPYEANHAYTISNTNYYSLTAAASRAANISVLGSDSTESCNLEMHRRSETDIDVLFHGRCCLR